MQVTVDAAERLLAHAERVGDLGDLGAGLHGPSPVFAVDYPTYRRSGDAKHQTNLVMRHGSVERANLKDIRLGESPTSGAANDSSVFNLVRLVFCSGSPSKMSLVDAWAIAASVSRLKIWRWSRTMRHLTHHGMNSPRPMPANAY